MLALHEGARGRGWRKLRYTAHRADANHWEILAALKKVTIVVDTHNCSGGMGDILARHVVTKQPVFLEVKQKQSDALTESESKFAADFRPNWQCVHSVAEALAAVGVPGEEREVG
jgi:hypothetical protein